MFLKFLNFLLAKFILSSWHKRKIFKHIIKNLDFIFSKSTHFKSIRSIIDTCSLKQDKTLIIIPVNFILEL